MTGFLCNRKTVRQDEPIRSSEQDWVKGAVNAPVGSDSNVEKAGFRV